MPYTPLPPITDKAEHFKDESDKVVLDDCPKTSKARNAPSTDEPDCDDPDNEVMDKGEKKRDDAN
jgi:hypothetical protein